MGVVKALDIHQAMKDTGLNVLASRLFSEPVRITLFMIFIIFVIVVINFVIVIIEKLSFQISVSHKGMRQKME